MSDTEVELQRIGSYITTRLLKSDSISSLYLSKQRKKDVVIKVFHAPLITLESKEAFLLRAKQIKKLKDRQIVELHDVGFVQDVDNNGGDRGYLVMQYVPGETLRQRVPAGQRIPADEVKRRLSPIASALHYAHVSSILHGNLHPDNLLIDSKDNTLLTDFSFSLQGLPFPTDQQSAAVPYMSPEQLQGRPTAASDQYALAVMAYEWLCGQRPYTATGREKLLHQQTHAPFAPPRSLNSDISPAVESVLLRALRFNPDERFQHIQAFADQYLRTLMGLPLILETKRIAPVSQIKPVAKNDHRQPTSPTTTTQQQKEDDSSQLTEVSPAIPVDQNNTANNGTAEQDMINDIPTATPFQNGEYRLADIITRDLCQGGILSQSLAGYEERPAQVEMATMVARSLTQNVPALLEASTGTGKTLAYLVPIVRSGKVAIVSTANKALQEQLFYKDIPFIQQHIKHFDAALVKGIGNYVCIDRLENERVGLQFYAKNRDFMRLVDITNDPDANFNGDFETLDFQLPGDIRGKVCGDSDQCAWSKCDYFSDCYVREMREKAARAQVIVVNHTLLLLDAAMDGYLLPERDVIVLDEAHHLEEEATRSFTITISENSVLTLLAQKMLKNHTLLSLQDEANKVLMNTWDRLNLVADLGFKGRANLQSPVEEGLKLATVISELADSLRKQRPKDLPEKESQLFDKLLKRTQNLAQNIRTVFSVDQPSKFVYYVERVARTGQRGFQLQVSAAPLDVTAWLKERLFDKCNVICTSATLATIGPDPAHPEDKGPNFAYFRRRTGLDPLERPDVIERILPLAFDFESNALLYVPRDLPAPVYGAGSDDYAKAIAREMYRLVKISQGRAFLLFSSRRMLDQAYDLMAPHLDYPVLRQGDMPRIELTRQFRQEKGAILFGLKSFWEGVDIVGEALSMVVIDKLPFDPPDDPVHEARVAQMKAAGENWFGIYVLPQAVLRLKQGLGRLLRTRDDRGVMAILDTRIYTKGYGKMVLEALPPARRTASIKDVERFFNEEPAPF
jgi:Rad3-related DNA helicase/serine/threonine protein kinase